MKITKIDIRAFVNVTEDLDKVIEAIHNILPKPLKKPISLTQKILKGYYGNQITLLKTCIQDEELIQTIIHKFKSELSNQDKEYLRREGNHHIEKGKLYIRFNKQSAYLNEIKLGSSDPIHLKIYFKEFRSKKPINIFQEFWGE
jgi:RNA binding exosome subunit